jgi:hypothetical protein
MDKAVLTKHLAQAERHVVLGEEHVRRQREIVAELDVWGAATPEARKLLANFEAILSMQIADRDRIRREVAIAR